MYISLSQNWGSVAHLKPDSPCLSLGQSLILETVPAMGVSPSPGKQGQLKASGFSLLNPWTGIIFDCKQTSQSGLLTLDYINVDDGCSLVHV